MEMIADSTFRVVNRSRSRSNILPGIYRVILDAPELDVTCAVLLYSEASSPTKSKGGRARVTIERLRRPRKKPPARLVGNLLWLDRTQLQELHSAKLLLPVSVERRFVPNGSDPSSKGRGGNRELARIDHEDRIAKMALFLDLVKLQECIIVHKSIAPLVSETMQTKRVSRAYIYKHWSSLCRWGMHESSLYPLRHRCGAPGEARPCDPPKNEAPTRGKAGRKSTAQRIARATGVPIASIQPGMSTDWRLRILAADKQIPRPKPPMPARIKLILGSSFVATAKDVDGEVKYELGPQGSYPNAQQIRRVLMWDSSQLERLAEQTTKHHFNSQLRGLTARSWKGVPGPAHTWAIDSTIGDIYLRSSVKRAWIIGRPIVYIIVDIWSTAIMGFYICLTGPSWSTAKVAIFNACMSHSLSTRIPQFALATQLVPAPTLCYRLLCDRGEYLSAGHKHTALKLDYDVAYTPPYRGDLKGTVEVQFRIIKDEQFWFIPGAMDARRHELELRKVDPRKCTFTLKDYADYLSIAFADYNFTANRSDRMTGEMRAAGVFPSPAGLWRWGHSVGAAYQRQVFEHDLVAELLPAATARVKSDGVWHAGCMYTSNHIHELEWTTRARNFGGWNVPVHHHPGGMETIWTPSPKDHQMFEMTLTGESRASPHYSMDEWADVLAKEVMDRPAEEHARLAASIQSRRRLQEIRDNANRLTQEAIDKFDGPMPTMTEARHLEEAASLAHPMAESCPLEVPRYEAEIAHDAMMSTLLERANRDR
ncbi:MAG: transposase [Hydrogenophaga sp.]|uniref:transposase n=1 Tax=Hydrogenophaga TaxID=47420 RepID=UPI0011C1B9E9|nr:MULTISPECIES: transposase [Hydrogenophaga]MBN9410322.1 transposase [Burkholderiales bacterium]NCT97962.1 transposase [Comamonadaceae bacterium]MBN9371853.1 transposase [Hydrogenophaga sp.]MBX3609557.1 transposase [Hydrogenophaga sp.]WQB84262.1 transposase [Hydrogenophaga sp. SNF1]